MKFGIFCAVLGLALGILPASAQDVHFYPPETTADAAAPVKKHKAVAKPAPKPAKPASRTAVAPAPVKPAPVKTIAAPIPVKPAPAPVAVVPALPPARDALADVPPAERAAIRAALLWSAGEDITGSIGGDDPIAAAIKAYQKRNKAKITGLLSAAEREELLGAAKRHDEEFGWAVMTDPTTGIRLGLPTKLVPNAREVADGMRWSSRHGDVQVETFRIKTNESLSALFEQQKKEPANRKVEYSVLRSDNFIVSGLQGLKKFAVRAQLKNGELRGVTFRYDQMMETIVTPVMVAMASALAPFPGNTIPLATLRRTVDYGTGLVVTPTGHIVTDRKLAENCQVIVAAGLGNAEPVATDVASGLALLRVYGKRNLHAAQFAPSGAPSGDLTLIGIPDPHTQNGASNLSELRGRLLDGNAIQLRQPMPVAGFSGAAALDAQGRLVGIMETRNTLLASVEPGIPPVRLISAQIIRDFLAGHSVKPAAEAGDAKAALVRVICVRK